MKKLICYLLALLFHRAPNVMAQSNGSKKLSVAEVTVLSNVYQQRALWFRDMPQFNRDSSVFYFDKAIALLKANPPLQDNRLADLYLDVTNIQTRSYSYDVLDSLAKIGWLYADKMPTNSRGKYIRYNFLINWASIKREKGDLSQSLDLFSKALTYIDETENGETQINAIKDKGLFYLRYDLDEKSERAFQNLSKVLNWYRMAGVQKKPVELFAIYRGMISCYRYKNKPDSSFYYLNLMRNTLPYLKNPLYHAWYYASVGRELITYPLTGQQTITPQQYKNGREQIVKSLAIMKTYKLYYSAIYPYCLGLLADLALRNKQYNQAVDFYKESRKAYVVSSSRFGACDMLIYIAKAYEQKGDLANALAYQKQYHEEITAYNEEYAKRTTLETDLQINVLKQEKQLNQKRNEQLIFMAALLVGFVLLGLLYRNVRLKQRANQKLESLNAELANKNALLDKRNADNELLLKEIHHRVKNNLEVVSSLLALQSARITDPNVQEVMLASQNRVHSMGIIHQKLYQGENLAAIEMRDYFRDLGQSNIDSFGMNGRVHIQCPMPELELDVDTAVAVGLIVNELLTNSLKYAFPGRPTGTITISLTEPETNALLLEVGDDGIGKSVDALPQSSGFGTQLIGLLVRQLNGSLTYQNNSGTFVSLHFKRSIAT